MLKSPFLYEEGLTATEFQKLGELSLRWSHIDHILGNCLKTMLRITDEQAVVMVFPLASAERLERLKKLSELKRINKDARTALDELNWVMPKVRTIRNDAIHAIVIDDPDGGQIFHRRSNKRSVTKEQVLAIEELTNYAAHAALALRYALGLKGLRGERHPLPDRPTVPSILRNPGPSKIRIGRQHSAPT